MKKKKKYTMILPNLSPVAIFKKTVWFGLFLFLGFSGYGQDISIAFVSNGEEDGTVNTIFRVSSGPSGYTGDIVVTYTIGGDADEGFDYATQTGSVNIPGNGGSESFADIIIVSIDDNLVEGNEEIIVTLQTTDNGVITQPTASAFILDDDVSVEFSVANSSDNEDDGGNLPVLLLNGRVNATKTVTVSDAGTGTATGAGDDYSFTSPTEVNITAGDYVDTTIPIPTLAIETDGIVEDDETLDLILSDPDGDVTLGTQTTTTYTIVNDDAATLSIAATTQAAEDDTDGEFTISTTSQFSTDVTVDISITGSALEGDDFEGIGTTVTFPANSDTTTIPVEVILDADIEGDETVVVTMSSTNNPDVGIGSPDNATVTITDDDSYIATITASGLTASENPLLGGTFTVSLDAVNTTGSDITVNYTVGGTATSGSDFTALSGTVTIADGQQDNTITLNPIDDTEIELDETVVLTLATGSDYTVGTTATATVTISSDDTATLSIAATTQAAEDNTDGEFTITTSDQFPTDTEVTFSVGGNATANSDYTTLGTTVTFLANSDTTIIPVGVLADTDIEGDETVVVTLTGTDNTNVTIGATDSATVTITDNDTATLSITATTQAAEDNTDGLFTITTSNQFPTATEVTFSVGGNATANSDYTALGTTVTFPEGTDSITLPVEVLSDASIEGDETVVVTLTGTDNTNVTIGANDSATVTITDNDTATLAITTTAQAAEDNTDGLFTITTTNQFNTAVTVDISITGSATEGTDYAAIGTTVNFPANTTSITLPVEVLADASVEGDETVVVTLTDTDNTDVTIGASDAATITITDNDFNAISINNVISDEGDFTTTQFDFTVSIEGGGDAVTDIGFTYSTQNGTATLADSDYVQVTNGSGTITAGTSSTLVTVNVNGDTKVEGDETFLVNLSAPVNATITDGEGLGTITNDDSATISINDPEPVNEGNSGTATLNFIVSIDASDSSSSITVDYEIEGGNQDGNVGSLTFPAATTTLSQTIAVTTDGDSVVEDDEEVKVTLSNPSANADIDNDNDVGESSFTDDDSAGLVVNDITVSEDGGSATFTITLNGSTLLGTSVDYQTSNNTAIAGDDYVSTSGTVIFGTGTDQTRSVEVTLIDDDVLESTETFFLDLSNPTGPFSTIVAGRGIATVTDDDNCAAAPVLNTDVQTTFCGTFGYDDGTPLSLNDYTDSTAPAGMVLTWSFDSYPLNVDAHLLPSEVNNITTGGSYYGFFYDADNNCASTSIEVELTLNPVPVIAETIGDERCGPGEVILSASGAVDVDTPPTFIWYDSATSTTPFATGSTITIPDLQETTSYYVEASANDCVSEREEVIAIIYPLPSAGTPTNASACNVAANGPTLVDLDDLLTGEGSGEWSVTSDPSNSISIGIGNIIDFEGLADGEYVFTFTTDNGTPPFCENVSSEVTITVNDCDVDTDGDGLFDGVEATLGTDPTNVDTDGDGIEDGVEVGGDTANPLDEDGDGIIDALDSNIADTDSDGVLDWLDPANTNPCLPNPDSEFCFATVDLEIIKASNVDNGYVTIGDYVTFTITVNNVSDELATSIQVREILDAIAFDYDSHFIATGGGVYDETTGLWEIPELDAGASVSLIINVRTIELGTFENTATISSVAPYDSNPENDEATIAIEVGLSTNNEPGFVFKMFSPNGDGINDYLFINDITDPEYANNTLEIYDRYGNQVFATKGYDNTWDGTRKNEQLPKGTYFYVLDLGDGSGVQKGWIQILR
ncbi:Calx-beta domain-containing protein [Maribacter polysaccharolyticus]|uniref:Calx-beta domain-containing protein n=1 Tax=Maribacter polysaccharolyticus TaxID=3020831 RepID=UPI00237FC8D3|nr:Calx-beta domain-containing protein [Maribacter polysaccharolyticus]MDE3741460.1 Calx-beta domain-containing protein [Maribacter polysaccharolyticus]